MESKCDGPVTGRYARKEGGSICVVLHVFGASHTMHADSKFREDALVSIQFQRERLIEQRRAGRSVQETSMEVGEWTGGMNASKRKVVFN